MWRYATGITEKIIAFYCGKSSFSAGPKVRSRPMQVHVVHLVSDIYKNRPAAFPKGFAAGRQKGHEGESVDQVVAGWSLSQ